MKSSKRIIFLSILVAIILPCIAYEFYVRSWIRSEISDGLNLIRGIDGNIYFTARGLYVLNPSSGKWELYFEPVRGYDHQNIVINSSTIVFHDWDDRKTKICPISDTNSVSILSEIERLSSPCNLSSNGRNLAYFEFLNPNAPRDSLVILDISKKEKRTFPNIHHGNSVSWSLDGKSLFLGLEGGITKLNTGNGRKETITEGHWVKVLPDNKIGFWRIEGGDFICYKMDIATKKEEEVFRTQHVLLGYDWDPSGTRVLISTSAAVHGFLIIPDFVNLLLVWDTNTKKLYRLPTVPRSKSGSIYWVGKK